MHTHGLSLQSSVCRYHVFWSYILWHLVSSFCKQHQIAHTTSKYPKPSATQKYKGFKVVIKTPLLHWRNFLLVYKCKINSFPRPAAWSRLWSVRACPWSRAGDLGHPPVPLVCARMETAGEAPGGNVLLQTCSLHSRVYTFNVQRPLSLKYYNANIVPQRRLCWRH